MLLSAFRRSVSRHLPSTPRTAGIPREVGSTLPLRALSSSTDPNSRFRVAVVGAGPGGFYSAKYLLLGEENLSIDMFEKFPCQYGLVRFGVAPDHQDTKSVQNDFAKVAGSDRFRFVGNVELGKDVSLEALQREYNAVVLAYGAAGDRELGLATENTPGVHSARAFVGWYNGEPDLADAQFDLSSETAVVFGNGNVAIDVARILCTPIDELRKTDIPQHCLEVLAESKVKRVHVVGRRGPVQAAFAIKETRELTTMEGCRPVISQDEMDIGLNEASLEEVEKQRALQRKLKLMKEIAERGSEASSPEEKELRLRFLLSPKEFVAGEDGRLQSVVCERNRLEGEAGRQKCLGTGEMETIETGLAFRSVGYKSLPVDGVPFDHSHNVVPSQNGRVADRLYVSGWLKRGPTGIIGTNIVDSKQTVKSVLSDLQSGGLGEPKKQVDVGSMLEQGTVVVDQDGWRRLEAEENSKGEELGKPREKFVRVPDMLGFLK